jgi:hypothetical protein
MSRGAVIDAGVFGTADGAPVNVRAAAVRLSGNARIQSDVGRPNNDGADPVLSAQNAGVTGDAGRITVRAGSLVIDDRAFISSFAFGPGKGADIDVRVAGRAFIHGPTLPPGASEQDAGLFTGLNAKTDDQAGPGNPGGAITLRAAELTLERGGSIGSVTKTARPAGDVTMAADRITFDGTGRESLTGVEARAGEADRATGRGGDIVVTGLAGPRSRVRSIRLIDGGVFSATTFGRGAGGNVTVRADDLSIVDDGDGFAGLFARSAAVRPKLGPAGPGGNVTLDAGDVRLRNTAARVTGEQDGASIAASSVGAGNAGSVTLRVRRLTLDNATVKASAARSPSAGDVTVANARSVTLVNGAALTTSAANDGGNIKVTARDLVRVDHSTLTAQSGASGKTLSIDPDFVVLNAATINGLDFNRTLTVTIAAERFLRSIDSRILTTLPPQLPPDIDLSNKVAPLRVEAFDVRAQLADQCGLRLGGDFAASSFLITGRGATPYAPGGASPSFDLWLHRVK